MNYFLFIGRKKTRFINKSIEVAIKSPTKHCRSVGVDVFVRVNCGKKPLMKYLQGINQCHKTKCVRQQENAMGAFLIVFFQLYS